MFARVAAWTICLFAATAAWAAPPAPTLEPLVRVVDLNLGESQQVTLCDGQKATVKLLSLKDSADELCGAVREARAEVEVNGQKVWLTSANYRLPVTVARRADRLPDHRGRCIATRTKDAWGLEKDARLRLWPAGSPLVEPGHVRLSGQAAVVRQHHADGQRAVLRRRRREAGREEDLLSLRPRLRRLRGAGRGGRGHRRPGRLGRAQETADGYDDTPVEPRYDVVYLLDARGWYYRYSHLHSIDAAISPARQVQDGPAHRPAGQGRGQRRLVAPALRHLLPAAVGQVGQPGGLRLRLGGLSRSSISRS